MDRQKFLEAYEKLEQWLSRKDLSPKLKRELMSLVEMLELDSGDKEAKEEVYDRFYKDLEFGTGGLRGVLGAGTNRMNIYTVRRTTQGFADYLKAQAREGERLSCAISYDSRILSDRFALESAAVFIANGILVYLYPRLMPTPCLSFAVRHYGCQGGIMITASHNPAKYNGYKAYNRHGCQVSLEEADAILGCIEKVDLFDGVRLADIDWENYKDGALRDEEGRTLLEIIPEATENLYIEQVLNRRVGVTCENLEVVYTPLNGAGNRPVRRILTEIGVGTVHVVPEQEKPDGNFPTCPYPNPEKREALRKGLELCDSLGTPDLLLATDPDCDRVGIAVRQEKDGGFEYRLLTGNETGILLLDFICANRPLPDQPVALETIVSSKMAGPLARHYGVELIQVLTGFKFIGEQIGILEEKGEEERFIFGFEESYGYLSGAYVRDKDAVNASMLICEMASLYKRQGKTLADRLDELYGQFGYYMNDILEFAFEGAKGMALMSRIMEGLRGAPPKQVYNRRVTEVADYEASVKRILTEGGKEAEREEIRLPKSDVLELALEDGSSLIVRPSGTEPKLKVYFSAKGESREESRRVINGLKGEVKGWIGRWTE